MTEPQPPLTLDDLLAGHAAGSLPQPVAVAVATHLALSPATRRRYNAYEALGGALLRTIAPAALAEDAWRRLQARLDDADCDEPPRPNSQVAANAARRGHDLVPRPLRDYLPGPVEGLHWRTRSPAVREAEVDLGAAGFEAALIHVRPGQPYPGHAHHEVDLVLTLEGGSTGEAGRFTQGHLAILGPGDSRLRVSDDDRDWLWLRVLGGRY